MPFYASLRGWQTEADRIRTAQGLLRLKQGLREAGIPPHALDDRVLIGTWNIREFDSAKGGIRTLESMLYIAEVLSAFDVVAVQEIREDLGPLDDLMRLMGDWWRVVFTDVTRGTSGNLERMAFLYDSRKVRFGGLVGEVVLPDKGTRDAAAFRRQFARTPFLVGFSVGWFKFTICTAHLYYGDDVADEPRRLEEIGNLASFLADTRTETHRWSRNVIMLGDFNVFSPTDKTVQAIEAAGFRIPANLKTFTSNLGRTKHYDQIAFRTPDVEDQLPEPAAGVFEWDRYVYRTVDEDAFEAARIASAAPRKPLTYATWRTYQMSDHLPMWVELRTDFSERFLTAITAVTPEAHSEAHSLAEAQDRARMLPQG